MKGSASDEVRSANGVHRQVILAEIRRRQRKEAVNMGPGLWTPDQLSDGAWLSLVAVPWLLHEVERHREGDGDEGKTEGEPGAQGIGPAQPALEFVLAEQPVAGAPRVVPAGNPLAQLFVGLVTKLMSIGFVAHGVRWLNGLPQRKQPQP